jgi:hypothetical protein
MRHSIPTFVSSPFPRFPSLQPRLPVGLTCFLLLVSQKCRVNLTGCTSRDHPCVSPIVPFSQSARIHRRRIHSCSQRAGTTPHSSFICDIDVLRSDLRFPNIVDDRPLELLRFVTERCANLGDTSSLDTTNRPFTAPPESRNHTHRGIWQSPVSDICDCRSRPVRVDGSMICSSPPRPVPDLILFGIRQLR